MDERRFRLDFVIALFALLISSVAAVATVYQTRVIASEFSATVWPYVGFDVYNSPAQVQVVLRNDGLGPAIIRSVRMDWNGKPQASLEAFLVAFARQEPQFQTAARAALRAGAKIRITTSTPTIGMVLPANSQHTIFEVDGAALVQYLKPPLEHVRVSLCYCSLTGSCWRLSSGEREPSAVSSCPKRA